MSAKHKTAGSFSSRFALHHLTSLALVMLGLGAFTFIGIADKVLAGDTLRFDRWLLLALRAPGNPGDPLGPPWVEELFRDFTALGGLGVLSLLTLATVGYLWLSGLRQVALFVLAAIVGGLLLSLVLKSGFDRPRPDLVSHGALVYTSSFPSGHGSALCKPIAE